MKRATRFPLKPERLTGVPSRAGRVKSGTSEPMRSVSVVICGSFLAVVDCAAIVDGLWRGCRMRGADGNCFRRYVKLPKLKLPNFSRNMGKQIQFPSAGSGQALRQDSGQPFNGWRRDFATFLATADVVDLLIDLHCANESVDGLEQ